MIKSLVVNEGNKQVQKLHKAVYQYTGTGVCAVENDAQDAGTSDGRRACRTLSAEEIRKVFRGRRTSVAQIIEGQQDLRL